MKCNIISHRGNINGHDYKLENNPTHILKLLETVKSERFYIELDVYKIDSEWFLGHDGPTYKIEPEFLNNGRLIFHAKNLEAFDSLINMNIHTFVHDSDPVVITSFGLLWSHCDTNLNNFSDTILSNMISVMPENDNIQKPETLNKCWGICTDFVNNYIEIKL